MCGDAAVARQSGSTQPVLWESLLFRGYVLCEAQHLGLEPTRPHEVPLGKLVLDLCPAKQPYAVSTP